MAGSGSLTTQSPPPCPSSSGINTTDAQEQRKENARIAKNKNKANVNNVAKIFRHAAEALERLETDSKKRLDAKVARAPVEKYLVPEAPGEKVQDIMNGPLLLRAVPAGSWIAEAWSWSNCPIHWHK